MNGRNVDIEFCWAKGKYGLLDKMAMDLVKKIGKRGKGVIATTGGTLSAKAAQRATEGTDIPILFVTGRDPVKVGLVASYERPGGNATGVTVDCAALVTQRLKLLQEMVPGDRKAVVLVHPDTQIAKMEEDAIDAATGKKTLVLAVRDYKEFGKKVGAFRKEKGALLLVQADPYFTAHRADIIEFAEQCEMPAIYPWQEYTQEGGLMSFSPSLTHAYRRIGLYTAKIVDGKRATDLPVLPPNTFDLGINLKTAKALDLKVPHGLLARADFVVG